MMVFIGWLVEVAGAGVVLLVALGVGMLFHELTHATVLYTLGVPFDFEWFPNRETRGLLGLGLYGTLAAVTIRSMPVSVSSWGLRLAALAPFVMALPFGLVLLGVLSDPVATGDPYYIAAALAWFGCAIPSPQDFSLFWHVDQLR